METKKTLKKIRLIEEPKSEELLRNELEEALGGWNCGSYYIGNDEKYCTAYDDGACTSANPSFNYCAKYTTSI